MTYGGETAPQGDLSLVKITADGVHIPMPNELPPAPEILPDMKLKDVVAHGLPQSGLSEEVNRWRKKNTRSIMGAYTRIKAARSFGFPVLHSALYLRKLCANGEVIDYGLAGMKQVVDNGCGFIVDAFQNLVELENMKYHGLGTGSSAEGSTETALVTELTTQYAGDVRATGTTAEASQKVYSTVATTTPDSGHPIALREHGIFSASTSGVLLDRTLYASISLDTAGDALQSTYTLTFNSGS